MGRHSHHGVGLFIALALSGCVPPNPAPAVPEPSKATTRLASTPMPQPPADYFGRVLQPDGSPAAGVLVRGYIISNNGANIISHNGGSLVSSNGGTFRTLGTALETRTDEAGHFKLVSEDGSPLNLEAVASETLKAFSPAVSSTANGLTMQLARTGHITGKVLPPASSRVTDMSGVDVYVPGTSYVAKTDAAGRFTLANIPSGTFSLLAGKLGLGSAEVSNVAVRSEQTTQAPDLKLEIKRPTISSIAPTNGGPGVEVTVKGDNFGASTGELLQISFGGVVHPSPRRIDDHTLKVEVPDGARTGDVFGIQSNTQAFTVLKTIEASDTKYLRKDSTQAFYVWVRDTGDQLVAQPTITIETEGGSVALGSQLITGRTIGPSTIKISSGKLSMAKVITVVNEAIVETAVGNGYAGYNEGISINSRFNHPSGITLDSEGGLLVTDAGNQRVRLIRFGERDVPTTALVAGIGSEGDDNGFGALKAQFRNPFGIARGRDDSIFVAEANGNRIRRITPGGGVTVFAGSLEPGFIDETGTSARFNVPLYLICDGTGDLFVSEAGNHAIRKVTAEGVVSTYAGGGSPGLVNGSSKSARFNIPAGLARDAQGNLFVADSGNHVIRKVSPNGTVTTYAGTGVSGLKNGAASEAQFNSPGGLAMGSDGTLYVADMDNNCIRAISPAGVVSTLAGSGLAGLSDALGPDARFNHPTSVVLDEPRRQLYVTDRYNHAIRIVQY